MEESTLLNFTSSNVLSPKIKRACVVREVAKERDKWTSEVSRNEPQEAKILHSRIKRPC
jgi:hypothetical protein